MRNRFTEQESHMSRALALASKGRRWVSPNPMVGAVLVMDGRVVAEGYHRCFGAPHAEAEALRGVEGPLRQATLYVNLEPCCHHGKTPPCTQRILEAEVGRVVVGVLDPNPQVRGRGVEELRAAGVDVVVGVLEERCREINRVFFHFMERGIPWVTLKWAQSLDGRIAAGSGDSKWISSILSRRMAHALRAEHDAVLVGAETLRRDDPRLTVRHVKGRNPLRVVLTSDLDVALEAKAFSLGPSDPGCWVACSQGARSDRAEALKEKGIRVVPCPADASGGVDLAFLLRELGKAGISSLLVEGGSSTITSFLRARLVQRVVCFLAPMVLGEGVGAVGDLGLEKVSQALPLGNWKVKRLGPDLMVDSVVAGLDRWS